MIAESIISSPWAWIAAPCALALLCVLVCDGSGSDGDCDGGD
jgi:hypothetical protein